MRRRHHSGLLERSPDCVLASSRTWSFSTPENTICPSRSAHWLNWSASRGTAASSMEVRRDQDKVQGDAARASEACRAATEETATVGGAFQLKSRRMATAGSAAGAASAAKPSCAGMENHSGAERPYCAAKSMARVSKRSCCPVARYRSNSVIQISSCCAGSSCWCCASTSSSPDSAPAWSPLANRMAASSRSGSCTNSSGSNAGAGAAVGAAGLKDASTVGVLPGSMVASVPPKRPMAMLSSANRGCTAGLVSSGAARLPGTVGA